MAQRRVNLPFVGAFLGVLVVLGCVLLGLKLLMHRNPKELRASAEQAMKQFPGEPGLKTAAEDLSRAIGIAPHDTGLRLEYAHVVRQLGELTSDDNAMKMAEQQWQEVLKDDPTNREALRAMLDVYVEPVAAGANAPVFFSRLKDIAERALKVNPDDPAYANDPGERAKVLELRRLAEAYQHVAVIAAWLSNIVTPEATLNQHIKGLEEMLKADVAANDPKRFNPDVPYYLCLAYWKQASEVRTIGADDAKDVAAKKEKLAYDTFDEVVRKDPDDPTMSLRFYQVLRALSAGTQDDALHGDRPDYVKRMYELLSHAAEVVKARAADDPIVDDVYLAYAEFMSRNREALLKGGKVAPEALPKWNEVVTTLYKLRPDDQDVRISYAQMLASTPAGRDQAIAMLQKEIVDRGGKTPLRPRNRRDMELRTYSLLIDFLLDASAQATDAAKRDAMHKEVDDAYQKVVDRDPRGYYTAFYKGKIALMTQPGTQGAIEAIPELERARDLYKQLYGSGHDFRLENMLADAYGRSNQTGLYKTQLTNLVHWLPQQVGPHKAMARVLMAEGHPDAAGDEIKEVARLEGAAAKDDKELQRLQAAMLAANPKALNPAEIEKSLGAMPENTPAEVHNKIMVCLYQKKVDEAIRLYEKMRQGQAPWPGPADIETVRSLVQLYMSQDKRAEATKVADEAIAKLPTTAPAQQKIALELVRAQLDKDVKKVTELTEQGIAAIADPVQRELTYFDFFRVQGKAADAEQHLAAAQKLDPENAHILDLRFQQALVGQKFDAAEALLPKLAEKNFDEAHGLIYRYRLAVARGDLHDADRVVQEMTDTLPQYARTWVYAGQLLQTQGKYSDAVERYGQALSRQSGNLDALRGLVQCYMAMQPPRQDDAWMYIQQGRQLFRDDPWFKEQEVAWELTYAPEKAIAPREAEVKENPDKMGPQLALYTAYWKLGVDLLQKGKYDDSKAPLQKAHDGLAQVVARWPGESEMEYAYFADVCTQVGDFAGGEKALKEFAASPKWKDSPSPSTMLAHYYERAGKVAEAEAAYKQAIELSHGATELRLRFSKFYANQGKYDQAIAALDANSTERAVQEQLLNTYIQAGRLTDANNLINKRLAVTPKDPMLLVTQATVRMQENKLVDALAILAAARAIEPHLSAAFYYQGVIHMKQGPEHYAEAIRDLTSARDYADPTNVTLQVQARQTLAEAMRGHGQQDDAITELTTALQLEPTNKAVRMKLVEMLATLVDPRWGDVENYIHQAQQMPAFAGDPDWYRAEASMWTQRHQDAKALAVIRQALAMTKGQLQRQLPLSQDYLMILWRMEKYPDLVAEATGLLDVPVLKDDGWWAYQMRAAALAKQGKKPEAMADYDKALAITARLHMDDAMTMTVQSLADTIGVDQAIARLEEQAKGGDDRWRITMVELYLRKGDTARAEAKADDLLANADKFKPEDAPNVFSVAGITYMTTGHYDKAVVAYDKLLKLVPEDTVALNNMACIWVDYKQPPDPAKALTYSTRAVEIVQRAGVSAPDLLDTHGWILTQSGRVDDGIGFLQQALERRPLLEAYYHMGVALTKKGLGPEAQVQLAKAQKMIADRKNKGQAVDAKLEANVAEAMTKAKAMANGSSAGTQDPAKP